MFAPRTLRIGASGHRDLGDEASQQFVAQNIRELLTSYRQQYPDLVLYAPLAIGADQLFVQTALDLHIPVEAVIPSKGYEMHYDSDAERAMYRRLLQQCRRVHTQPFFQPTDDAYLAAGQWIVEHSDVVLLVWNGQPAKGRGGTADIASYARQIGCPFQVIQNQKHLLQTYGEISQRSSLSSSIKREEAVGKQLLYQGPTLTLYQYRYQTNSKEDVVRDIVERPESVGKLTQRLTEFVLKDGKFH